MKALHSNSTLQVPVLDQGPEGSHRIYPEHLATTCDSPSEVDQEGVEIEITTEKEAIKCTFDRFIAAPHFVR